MADADLRDLDAELETYARFRRRSGAVNYSRRSALLDHRRQVLENLADSGEDLWVDRCRLLDRYAEANGIPLYDEPALSFVLETLKNQERARRDSLVMTREGES